MKRNQLNAQEGMHGVPPLDRALSRFDHSAARLTRSFESLQDRIGTLNREMERENRELARTLREKEDVKNYFYSILESLPTGVLVVSGAGRVVTCNTAVERMVGMRKSEIEGEDFNHVLGPLFPAGFSPVVARRDRDAYEGECIISQCPGRELNVQFSVVPLREPMNAGPAGDESALVILHDITRIKRLEEQAGRTSRLTAMGEIAVNIAHEIRNPLGSIELLASLIRQEVEADEDRKRLMDHILSGVKSIDCIIANLLLFCTPPAPVPEKLSLNRLLDEVLALSGPSLRQRRVEAVRRGDGPDAAVMADRELLKQAFLNIIWNALQAMPGGGTLMIVTERAGTPAGRMGADRWVEVGFTDSGTGMVDDVRQKIFDPFFTTKEKGAGLGLAIVHNIIGAHGGMIGVASREGAGSTFTVSLPLAGAGEREEGDG